MVVMDILIWLLDVERLSKSFAFEQIADFRLKDGMDTW